MLADGLARLPRPCKMTAGRGQCGPAEPMLPSQPDLTLLVGSSKRLPSAPRLSGSGPAPGVNGAAPATAVNGALVNGSRRASMASTQLRPGAGAGPGATAGAAGAAGTRRASRSYNVSPCAVIAVLCCAWCWRGALRRGCLGAWDRSRAEQS